MATDNTQGGAVLKRLLDETALRVAMSEADLRAVIGSEVASHAIERQAKLRRKGQKGAAFLGFTVQCMQQLAHFSCVSESSEAIIPPNDHPAQNHIGNWQRADVQRLGAKRS